MLIKDIYNAFQQGKSLANSAIWKNRAIAANALAMFATAALGIASVFGYKIDLDQESIQAIAGGIAAVVCMFNTGVHVVTSDKVGLPPKAESQPAETAPDFIEP